jgi:hypothetical protein
MLCWALGYDPRKLPAQQNHWSGCGRATSVTKEDAARPHRSVLALDLRRLTRYNAIRSMKKIAAALTGLAMLALLSGCRPASESVAVPKTNAAGGLLRPEKADTLLSSIYTNAPNWDGNRWMLVMGQWKRMVADAVTKTNVVTLCIAGAEPGRGRSDILAQLGKPDATSKEPVSGMVGPDGNPTGGHFLWFGSLGICFIGDGPQDTMIAIGYDPKRNKL